MFYATKIQRLLPLPAAQLTPGPSLLKRGEKIQFLKGFCHGTGNLQLSMVEVCNFDHIFYEFLIHLRRSNIYDLAVFIHVGE
jgi:hypothetical protein